MLQMTRQVDTSARHLLVPTAQQAADQVELSSGMDILIVLLPYSRSMFGPLVHLLP